MTNSRLKERRRDLDIAKGIGIFLVVWGHANGPKSDIIGQFHMPLFFFISGMLFDDEGKISDYIKRKGNSLLIPFWRWNLFLFPLFYILYYWKQWSFRTLVIGFIEIIFTVNKVPFLGATWFLPALFWTSVFWKVVLELISDYKCCDFILLILGGHDDNRVCN